MINNQKLYGSASTFFSLDYSQMYKHFHNKFTRIMELFYVIIINDNGTARRNHQNTSVIKHSAISTNKCFKLVISSISI